MVSTEGLVPITRAFLASYYDKYPFTPLSDDVSRLSQQIYAMATTDLLKDSPPAQGESSLIREAESEPPHKVDENMWKNREQIEEILFLLEAPHWPRALQQRSTVEDEELASVLGRLQDKFKSTLQTLESFQARNSEFVFNTVMTYMPQDFRGTIIRQQKERSERNKQAVIDALVSSGGSIHDKYALLWKQQMDRRKQLAQLGSATGVYKTMMKYLVGVPEVLMDFVRQINDDQGCTLASDTSFRNNKFFHHDPIILKFRGSNSIAPSNVLNSIYHQAHGGAATTIWTTSKDQISVLEEAANVYTSELERFIKFIGEVFTNSPFLITAEDAGALTARKNDEYKEISVPAGETHEVSLTVEAINSYIAWDFSLVQGKLNLQDIGFSVECVDLSGRKTLILPYRRYEADQGNFCTCASGDYKLIWDNSYSTFFRKVIRYKVDCIPPVVAAADQ